MENNKFIISKVCGRLGNFMFQTICGKQHAAKFGYNFMFQFKDSLSQNQEFDFITKRFNESHLAPTGQTEYYREINPKTYNTIPAPHSNVFFLDGYFEHEQYFSQDLALSLFDFSRETKDRLTSMYGDLSDCVSISIRLGDFKTLGISAPLEWYQAQYDKYFFGKKAIVASDNIVEAANFLNIENAIFLYNSTPEDDLYIPSLCGDHIVSNSTFSWWGAYLGEARFKRDTGYESKIIAYRNGRGVQSVPERWVIEH